MVTARFSRHSPRAVAARRAISDLVSQEPPSRDLLDAVDRRLQRVVPFDSGGWWTSDPETLLPTELWNFNYSDIERELAQQTGVRIEALDASGQSAAATSAESSQNTSVSQIGGRRGSEMRVLARDGESAWGSACLTRSDIASSFTPDEVSYVAGIAKEVGFALRTDLLRVAMNATSKSPQTSGLGTVLLSPDGTVEGYTPEARGWLERLGVTDFAAPLPTALRWISLQASALNAERGGAPRLRPARSGLASEGGDLIFVQAEVLHGSSTPKVVMSFESAKTKTLFPLLLALHGLTAREKTVAGLIVGGWPLEEVAAHLALSLYTVRDHVKNIYLKVGVRSRPELTAQLGGGTDSYAAGQPHA